ncbi:unnamed protein product [Coregonus sp. 'balchen']|nr:unnamed protein product [Coregonus sp. 'balchen']
MSALPGANRDVLFVLFAGWVLAVKRLMKEAAELRDPTEHYHAQPLENRAAPGVPYEAPQHNPTHIRTALIAIIGFMPTKGEGAIGSLDYNPEERRGLAKKSQDFCCETCGCSMRSALLGPSPTNPSPDDQEDQELAQQINFKAEARQASESTGAESGPPTDPQGETSTSRGQEEEEAHAEQRRAQQHQREPPSRPTFPAFPHTAASHPPQDASHTGSVVLIIVLTLLLAALIFRRIYLTNEYKFDYEL